MQPGSGARDTGEAPAVPLAWQAGEGEKCFKKVKKKKKAPKQKAEVIFLARKSAPSKCLRVGFNISRNILGQGGEKVLLSPWRAEPSNPQMP